MCYSAESSLRTSAISGVAIVYLLLSGIPHYQWVGVMLIGWCGMQFVEYLLWSTNPRKGCTDMNRLYTMTLIPLALALQPLGSLFGSLFIIPWNKSSPFRKNFIIVFTIFVILDIFYLHFYNPYKTCTIVTDDYHLHWHTSKYNHVDNYRMAYTAWGAIIILPILMYWDKSWVFMLALLITPVFGFIYGLYTDSKASLWCYYTSYTSIIAIVALAAKQLGFGDAMRLRLT